MKPWHSLIIVLVYKGVYSTRCENVKDLQQIPKKLAKASQIVAEITPSNACIGGS